MNSDITIAPWLDGKRWVYSITFDEALVELHRFAVPILARHNAPGHIEAVVGHLGIERQIGQSSYNGFHHMSGPQMREMLDRGWGVGNHSWSHMVVNADTADIELGKAKVVLEEAIGEPITVYCSCGDNQNMNAGALAACRKFGYLGAMSITDALNRPDDEDLMWMNRTFLHEQGYGPFFSAFDPFRNIALAKRDNGWIIDYCHCPLEKAVHPNKDCSEAQLRERIETVVSEGGDEVWLARVEDAVDYRYVRRHTKIDKRSPNEFVLSAPGLPEAVRKRTITLELPADVAAAEYNGARVNILKRGERSLLNVDVATQPKTLRLIRRGA
ncbi:MAG TPA: polysaccharide deacetylase family protein [Tepidisphaeraceae bacterium]|jgi:peptidoglycan/xylan/chitin deacetylase (PgdA/CDA1 family)|nr:polysaccharide deacetylase family protein [Tepidisphaeraceae bacterium]